MTLVQTPSKFILYQGNTHTMSLVGILDGTTQVFWNASASISGTLVDDQGNQVQEVIAVPFFFVPGSNGVFTASFGDFNFQPSVGTGYTFIIDGIQNGVTLHLELLTEVQARSS